MSLVADLITSNLESAAQRLSRRRTWQSIMFDRPLPTPLRIACYGYTERDAGSISSAGYLMLCELLNRGHKVDWFGKRSFAYPIGLETITNFRFVNTEGKLERLFGRGCSVGPAMLRIVAGRLTSDQTRRNVSAMMAAEHSRRPYDVGLYLGNWAFARVPDIKIVSFVQGAPGTDGDSIGRHADQIRRLEGKFRYMALRAYAAYRNTLGKPSFLHTDVVVCGSRWSADRLAKAIPTNVPIYSLPYPIDLDTFNPDSSGRSRLATPVVLWAGRSVPRKRLDLFLNACSHLLRLGRKFDVRVVGGFGFTPGYRKLIGTFEFPERLRYQPNVPRAQMPEVYRESSVLVQPSEEEDFGSAVAEALSCGTPVVLGPTNGTADYVADAGKRFENYTTEAVADAIAEVLDGMIADPAGWATRARSAAILHFDVRAICDCLSGILRGIPPS